MRSNPMGKKAQSRQRIVEAASKAVRRAGFHGVSVASVMKDAGLTHGGFYAHFPSRDALLAEAVLQASATTGELIGTSVSQGTKRGRSAFRAFVEAYLSDGQIANREDGCPVAALCGEMPGLCSQVGDSARRIVDNLHGFVQRVMPVGAASPAGWAVTSALVGAVQLARALGDNDDGRAVLASARAQLLLQYDQLH